MADALEGLLGGGVLPRGGALGFRVEAHALEENRAHLSRRLNIKLLACQLPYLALEHLQLILEARAYGFQGLGVEADACALHLREHCHEGHLRLREEVVGALVAEHGKEDVVEAQGDVGILGGVRAYALHCHLAHRELFLAALLRAYELVDVDCAVTQVGLGQIVHTVVHLGLQDVVCDHGVEHRAAHLDAVVGEHIDVVF